MNPSIKELNESERYTLIEKINYKEMLPFILPYMKPRNYLMVGFYLLNLLFLGLFAEMLIANGIHHYLKSRELYFILVVSFVIIMLLIPIHELLHGLAFKVIGAAKLTFGVNLREMVFYVTSDRFVLNKSQFYFLALVPFVIITASIILFYIAGSFGIKLLSAFVVFFHSTSCVGDFALIAYFQMNAPNKQAYTYDEIESKTSSFYIERQ